MSGSDRVQRRKERVHAAILENAERQFLDKGYTQTTLEAIAQAADVGVGTIYSYFEGKSDLFVAVIDREMNLLESYQAEAFKPELSPRKQLIAVGETYLRFASDHPRHFLLLNLVDGDGPMGEADSSAARRKAQLDERVAAVVGRLANIIRKIVAEKDPGLVDADQLAYFLWGAWNGVITLHLQNNAHRLDTAAAEAMLVQGRRLLIAGLEAMLTTDRTYDW